MTKDFALGSNYLGPNILRMNLKNQLQFYIKLRGMTAAELSRKSGVPKQRLSNWLANQSPKNLHQVKAVADVLRTTVDNLCFGTGEEEPKSNADLDALLGSGWISGLFEVKFRRVKKSQREDV